MNCWVIYPGSLAGQFSNLLNTPAQNIAAPGNLAVETCVVHNLDVAGHKLQGTYGHEGAYIKVAGTYGFLPHFLQRTTVRLKRVVRCKTPMRRRMHAGVTGKRALLIQQRHCFAPRYLKMAATNLRILVQHASSCSWRCNEVTVPVHRSPPPAYVV